MSSRSIVSVVGDAGGAEAMAPLLVALDRRGRLGAVVARPAGAQALEGAGIGYLPHDGGDAGAFLDRVGPSLVVTTTSWSEPPVELEFLEAAQVRGIPTVAIVDFWANYRRRFEWPQGSLTLADRIVVPDELAREEAIAEGLPADRIEPLGNPHYEALLERFGHFDQQARGALRERVGVRRHATLLLFASQPIRSLYGDSLGYDEFGVLAAVSRAAGEVAEWLGHRVEIAVRAHPREGSVVIPETNDLVRFRSAAGEDAVGWALAADLVVGMTSAVLLQAALLGARVVSVQPGLRGPDRLPGNRLGLTDGIYTEGEVAAGLYRALARPAHTQKARVLHRMRQAATGATSRVLRLLDQMTTTEAGVGR